MMSTMLAAEERPPQPPPKLHILSKIAYLLGARWFQEALQTVFFIYLARVSAATYGEFMMALGLGSILLMVAEFGLNLPFVGLAAGSREKVDGYPQPGFDSEGAVFSPGPGRSFGF